MLALRPCAMAILAMVEHGQGCPWHVRRGTAVAGRVRPDGRDARFETVFSFSKGEKVDRDRRTHQASRAG